MSFGNKNCHVEFMAFPCGEIITLISMIFEKDHVTCIEILRSKYGLILGLDRNRTINYKILSNQETLPVKHELEFLITISNNAGWFIRNPQYDESQSYGMKCKYDWKVGSTGTYYCLHIIVCQCFSFRSYHHMGYT